MYFNTHERKFIAGAIEIISLHPEADDIVFWEFDGGCLLWVRWAGEEDYTAAFFIHDEATVLIALDAIMNSVIDAYGIFNQGGAR